MKCEDDVWWVEYGEDADDEFTIGTGCTNWTHSGTVFDGETEIEYTVGTDPRILKPVTTGCTCLDDLPGTLRAKFIPNNFRCEDCLGGEFLTLTRTDDIWRGEGPVCGRQILLEMWCSGSPAEYQIRLKMKDGCFCPDWFSYQQSVQCDPDPLKIICQAMVWPCPDCIPFEGPVAQAFHLEIIDPLNPPPP